MLTNEHKTYIEKCILSWLASSSANNEPNVSPKEIFTHFEDKYILVANIASPQTIMNIKANPQVCISILDILLQKGFQFKGTAKIIKKGDSTRELLHGPLHAMAGEKFPFNSLTQITITHAKPILAPSYLFYPETSEQEQIAAAKKAYGLDK